MAHYAFLDENNIVTEIIVGQNEDEVVDGISDWEEYYGQKRGQACKRTSYNSNIRKNYATVGSRYDEDLDAFISPSPFPSWIFDSEICGWKPPIQRPDTEEFKFWNEDTLSWI